VRGGRPGRRATPRTSSTPPRRAVAKRWPTRRTPRARRRRGPRPTRTPRTTLTRRTPRATRPSPSRSSPSGTGCRSRAGPTRRC
jgi:hypothetical protein